MTGMNFWLRQQFLVFISGFQLTALLAASTQQLTNVICIQIMNTNPIETIANGNANAFNIPKWLSAIRDTGAEHMSQKI